MVRLGPITCENIRVTFHVGILAPTTANYHQESLPLRPAPSMASALTRIALPTLKLASLPRRIALCVAPRYFSRVPPRWTARPPTTPPADVQSAEVQPEQDDGDPMEIEEKEWGYDDFTSAGHAELERHREARQYARITMYEMPRLSGTSPPPLSLTPDRGRRLIHQQN
jgi:hypothetical protein